MLRVRISPGPVPYLEALAEMERTAAEVTAGAPELLWLSEHPACYTAGTGANAAHLLSSARFPVYETGRGGDYTYHGPGQRMIYPIISLQRRRLGPREYMRLLQKAVIRALERFDVYGEIVPERPGVWVGRNKIAAVGVRIRRGTAFHGAALNVAPDLRCFDDIVPCGLHGYGVTSLYALNEGAVDAADAALIEAFSEYFPDLNE